MAVRGAGLYRQALEIDPNHYEANWKLARNLVWIAEHQKKQKAARKKTAEEAIERAKKAIEVKPDDPAGHFFLALAYGYYGEANGILDTLWLLKPAQDELRKVMELEPDYLCGGAYVAFGWGYHFLPAYR
jgi:tetratricopeptide (TPR) repeat protein